MGGDWVSTTGLVLAVRGQGETRPPAPVPQVLRRRRFLGIVLYFQAQDPENEDEVKEFVWPLHEGVQSLCTRGLTWRIVTWWCDGRVANSYSWLPHRYPPGHYVLRFVYRPQDPYQDELPPLSSFAWSVVRANLQSNSVPPSIRDPLGVSRHVIRYTDDNGLGRDPTCHPRNCVYLGMLHELQWLRMLDLLTYTGL